MRLVGLQELASLFPKYRVTFKRKEYPPMPFTFQLPTYQVETKASSTLYPSKKEANNHYQRLEKDNVPCELYEDGRLQKEYKPN